ncbi:LPPG:FO 2-phospho-L-lactate transferase [Jatrophihabitans sp. GAS493]|uniref:2-phospho-L-lactate transferase n=1 Tax=Jatrophihabitans sp. GAS493 TaxID=1907575 RepID=UPI000BB93BB2|nr:2-phospho-L-lactate transferase [Jatrophihabitans sp. GAS493]SOD73022.1 LPPG:FO 2-phospho-L-lactate transferase [Jatrophihabitans sp. GAS493]
MQITVLAGGIGGARFLRGVRRAYPDAQITAVINTGDDITLHGLRICPDLDSVMYTLGGGTDTERGWGRADESWRVKEELARYGAEPSWFGLGDLDLATHLVRTQMLDAGYSLTDVTGALCDRWQPGIRMLPMTDARCETHVVVQLDGARRAIHFQQWWIKHRAELPAESFVQIGLEDAKPTEAVLSAIADADILLIAPSNPVVSIGTILNVPTMREALRASAAPVVGLSPIIGNAPVRGMADSCLPAIGVEVSAEGVGRHYGARSADGVLDGWLIQSGESADIPGVSVLPTPLLMSDDEATAQMVRDAFAVAGLTSAAR